MANNPQARKRARQSEKRRRHNQALRSAMRTRVKKTVKAIESGNAGDSTQAYAAAVKAVDQAAGKGIIHKNKAARHKSRLNARIRGLQAAAEAPATA